LKPVIGFGLQRLVVAAGEWRNQRNESKTQCFLRLPKKGPDWLKKIMVVSVVILTGLNKEGA
jgi:hypothetical protein